MSSHRFGWARSALGWVLAFVLGCALTAGLRDSAARVVLAHPRSLSASEVHFTVAAADGAACALRFEFAAPMAATAASVIAIHPATPFVERWSSRTALDVLLERPLPRAIATRVRLAKGLACADGRTLADDLVFDVVTPGPRVTEIAVATAATAALAFEFDLPIASKALCAALTVATVDGAPLAFELAAQPEVLAAAGLRRHVVRVLPPESGPAPERVAIALDGALRSTVGELPMGERFTATVDLFAPLVLVRVDAQRHGVELRFNRQLSDFDATLVTLEAPSPAAPLPFTAQLRRGGLFLVGALPPGGAITVRLAAGFPGRGSLRLETALARTLFVPDLAQNVDFARPGEVLSCNAWPELEIESVNIERFALSIAAVYPNNLVALAHDPWFARDHLAAPADRAEFAVAGPKNQPVRTRVDLRQFLGAAPRGAYIVELARADGCWSWPRRRLLQLTDLGLTVRVAAREAVVAVRTLARDEAVGAAEVALYTPTNQLLARGTTGDDGLVRLPFAGGAADRVPFLLVARSGDELAWLELDRHPLDLAHLPVGGVPGTPPGGLEVDLHAARGVARPGETLDVTALVRERDGRAAAGVPLIVRWIDARGRLRRRSEVAVPGSGLLALRFTTAPTDPTGAWRVELLRGELAESDAARTRLGDVTLFVEAFVAERIEVEGELAAPLVAGEPGEWIVRGRWLAGGPVAGRRIVVRPRIDLGDFAPSDWSGAEFGVSAPPPPPGDLPALESVTDARGEARVRFPCPNLPDGVAAWQVRLVAEVDDGSGRVARAVTVATALRAEFTLGARIVSGGIEVVALDRAGALRDAAVAITVEVEERRYEWEWDADSRWQSRIAKTVVATLPATLVGGRARVALPPLSATTERARWRVAVVRGAAQSCELQLTPEPARPDRLALSAPTLLTAGAPFELAVEAPFAGQALVTLESDGIVAARSVALLAGRSTIALTLPADLVVPTVHAFVTLTRPQARPNRDEPGWLIGALPLAIDRSAAFLPVTLALEPEVRPERRVSIAIEAPGATVATVALVDVGVLRLTRHRDPDPRATLLATRRLATRGADSRAALLEGARYPAEALVGGDDGDDGDFAARLDVDGKAGETSVALFRGEVALDAAGRAQVEFELPPYEGRLRCAVIAAGSTQVGAAAADVVVSAPLGLHVALPRRLANGDTTQALVTLRNRTGASGTAIIDLETVSPLHLATGFAARQMVDLADGEIRDLTLPFVAGAIRGDGTLRVTARLDQHERSVAVTLPIAPRGRFERRRRALVLPAGETTLPFDDDWLGDAVDARLVVDPRPDRQLEPVLRALIDYPYGCAEQTSSCGQALLLAHQLLPQLTRDLEREPARLLEVAIERLLSMQTAAGGFAFWPGDDAPHRFGTLAALDLLQRAAAAGFAVPAESMSAAVRWLEGSLPLCEPTVADCFAFELLLRSGRPLASRFEAFAAAPPTAESALLLALAGARLGRDAEAKALLARAVDPALAWPARAGEEVFESLLRRDALELLARLALDPADPAAAARVEGLRQAIAMPDFLSTQEQVHALRALSTWWARFAGGSDGAAAILVRGDARQLLEAGDPHAWRWSSRETVRVECDSVRYAVLEAVGMRGDEAATSFPGLTLERQFVDAEAGAVLPPEAPLKRGRLYDVVLRGRVGRPLRQLLLTDLLSGGVESESRRLLQVIGAETDDQAPATHLVSVDHFEGRDDRVLFFFSTTAADGAFELRHRVRAVFPGSYSGGGASVEALYQPSRMATVASRTIIVSP